MVFCLQLMGWVSGLAVGADGFMRIMNSIHAFNMKGPLPVWPSDVVELARTLMWAGIGIGAVEIVLAGTMMAICLGLAMVIERLDRLALAEQRIGQPVPVTVAPDRPAPIRPTIPSRPGPQIGEGTVQAAPFRWPD